MKTALLTTSTQLTFSDSQNAIANSFLFIRTLSKKILAPASSFLLWASSFCFVFNNFFLSSASFFKAKDKSAVYTVHTYSYMYILVNCQTCENKIPMPMARFLFIKVFPASAAREVKTVKTVCAASSSNVDNDVSNSCCKIREPFKLENM